VPAARTAPVRVRVRVARPVAARRADRTAPRPAAPARGAVESPPRAPVPVVVAANRAQAPAARGRAAPARAAATVVVAEAARGAAARAAGAAAAEPPPTRCAERTPEP